MKVSLCVGNYAQTPYSITGLQIPVYCIEELCCSIKEKAFLLDMSFMTASLVDWINDECGLTELAGELYPMVRKKGALSTFVTLIMEYVGLFDEAVIREIERVLREGSGLSMLEKRKNQIDYLVTKKKYMDAIKAYDELLIKWDLENIQGNSPEYETKAKILHNKGVAYAGLFEYGMAAENFLASFEVDNNLSYYKDYISAKRMELTESDYLNFISEEPDSYNISLELEHRIETMDNEFAEQEFCKYLVTLEMWRNGSDRQKYYDEIDKIAVLLKDSYRSSVLD